MVRVFLKRSKTDQFGRGTEVFLGATGDELCPVRAVSSYVAHRGTAAGAFFRTSAGMAVMFHCVLGLHVLLLTAYGLV